MTWNVSPFPRELISVCPEQVRQEPQTPRAASGPLIGQCQPWHPLIGHGAPSVTHDTSIRYLQL